MLTLKINFPKGYAFTLDKTGARRVLRQAGAEVAARAKALIRQRMAGGAKRTASKPGEPPVGRSGVLARSFKISPSRDGDRVTIRDAAFYALFLEGGARGGGNPGKRAVAAAINPKTGKRKRFKGVYNTRVLLPRPFLSTAFEQVANQSLSDRIVSSIVDGIAFRKQK